MPDLGTFFIVVISECFIHYHHKSPIVQLNIKLNIPEKTLNRDTSPAMDSSKNILEILNDDCIEAILDKLTNLRDVINVRAVCNSFLWNSRGFFHRSDGTLCINDFQDLKIDRDEKELYYNANVKSVENVLKKYAHLIETIVWKAGGYRNKDVFSLISKYCGETLRELRVEDHELQFSESQKFQQLNSLEMIGATTVNFDSIYFPIKRLKLKSVNISNNFCRHFPKLEVVEFDHIDLLTVRKFQEFLYNNHQLKNIKLNFCKNLTSSIAKDLAMHASNLEHLTFHFWSDDDCQSNFDANIVHLSQLPKLKSLSIRWDKFSTAALINSLGDNKVPIEQLEIEKKASDFIESLPKMKWIKKLTLVNSSDDMLINIANSLPMLHEIVIKRGRNVTIDGLKEFVECAKNLRTLSVKTIAWEIHRKQYESILAIVKNRVRADLINVGGVCKVPNDILVANSRWLQIDCQKRTSHHI